MNGRLNLAVCKISRFNTRNPAATLGALLNALEPDYSFGWRLWRLPIILLGLSKSYRDNQRAKAIEKVIKGIEIDIRQP